MSCSKNPPPHDGYKVWTGPVPLAIVQWASELLYGIKGHLRPPVKEVPFGYEWTMDYGGEYLIARKDWHDWTYRNGVLTTGCFTGITIYRPLTPGETPVYPPPKGADVAQYSADEGIDWGMVAVSAGAGAAVVGLFWLALHHAGNANHSRRRLPQ